MRQQDHSQTERDTYRWDDERVLADPFPTYARLLESAPVRFEPTHDAWHIAGYEQVLTAIKDESALRAQIDRSDFLTRWPDAQEEAIIVRKFFDSWMLFKDPPHHTRIRALISRFYTRSRMAQFRPDVERVAARLLDAAAERGHMDVVADYAVPLAKVGLERLLGASGDELAEATRWSDEIAGYMNVEATADTVRQVAPVILEVKRFAIDFCTRDDLPEDTVGGALGRAYKRGVLDENELAATLTQNITGALAALAQFIAHATLRLLENSDQLQRLRSDASLTANAVEELLRYDCPFLLIVRQSTRDIEVGEAKIPRDSMVGLMIGAANRDPHRFPDPGRLDLGREGKHLAFGYGAHYCLGAALSREVGEVAIGSLINRFPNMELVPGAERVASFGIRWLKNLPIVLEGKTDLAETISEHADGAAAALADVERLVAGFRSELMRRCDELISDLNSRFPSVRALPPAAEAKLSGAASARKQPGPTAYQPRRAREIDGLPVRGGVLAVNITNDTDSTDPARAWHATSWQYEFITQAKLLNHPDTPGPEGSRLVPEVAVDFPEVSDDQRTYTFTIRSGGDAFRLSTGEIVTAENFTAAINRALDPEMQSPASMFVKDVLGAEDVLAGRARRAEGVRALPDNKLQIELTDAAPDFLSRMAMPFFGAIPVELPVVAEGVDFVPSAGPYYVAGREQGRSIRLKRNPYYRHSRPAYVDEIVYRIGMTPHESLEEIERHIADYHADGLPVEEGERLAGTYGVNDGRFLVAPMLHFDYIAMNTSRPLFSDLRVRRAVNFALDRPAQLEARGAYGGVVTDHILPPGMPGYRDERSYPLDGPDVERARAELPPGFPGGRAVFYTNSTLAGPAIGRLMTRDLAHIGIEVEVHEYSEHEKHERAMKRGEPFDLVVTGWVAGYPDPFICINPLLHGSLIRDQHNYNFAFFDDSDWNRKLDATARLFPPERYEAYGQLDLEIVRNAAPWAVMGNRTRRDFVSSRTRGAFHHPVYGLHLGALWIAPGERDGP